MKAGASSSSSLVSDIEAGQEIAKPTISIVEQILADFSEFDNECPSPSPVKQIAIDGCEINSARINNNKNTLIKEIFNLPKTTNYAKKTDGGES